MTLNEYREYEEIMEAILKATGNFEIFKPFEEKIQRTSTTDQLRQNVIILTSLAAAVKDYALKEELYQKIIEELVVYVFQVKQQ